MKYLLIIPFSLILIKLLKTAYGATSSKKTFPGNIEKSRYILKIFILLICFFVPVFGYGQIGGSNLIVPATPNTASLFKVAKHPAATFTGIPSISVPLFKFNQGDFELPISLNYTSGGIKVEEIASWVGLGWGLNVGGTITRIVRGLPDDSNYGYCHTASQLKPANVAPVPQTPGPEYNSYKPGPLTDVAENKLDLEPDVYYYNINGMSGKFLFDTNGQVVQDLYSGMKINPMWSGNAIVGWTCIDSAGNRYYLGTSSNGSYTAFDETVNFDERSIPQFSEKEIIPNYTTTWYLVQMMNMNGLDEVNFKYNSNITDFFVKGEASQIIYNASSLVFDWPCDELTTGSGSPFLSSQREHYLYQIIGKSGTVTFNTVADREDLSNGRKLNSIVLTDPVNEVIKSFDFNYDYFLSPTPSYIGSYSNHIIKRLKLLSLTEYDKNHEGLKPYTFSYYEDSQLPDRFSKSIDYWGYFNGSNSTSSLPNISWFNGTTKLDFSNFANRTSNWEFARAGTLKKIIYPTGGSTEYFYEGNTVLYNPANYVQIVQSPEDKSTFEYKQISIHPDDLNYGNGMVLAQRNFSINSSDGHSNFVYMISAPNCDYQYVLINLSNSNSFELESNVVERSLELPNGSYELQVRARYEPIQMCNFTNLDASWTENRMATTTIDRSGQPYYRYNVSAGGIRIKQISDYDPVTSSTTDIKYDYNLFSDPSLTSGMLISTPVFAGTQYTSSDQCRWIVLSSSSYYPLAQQSSSYVAYTDVRTSQTNNGYVQQKFSFAHDPLPATFSPGVFPTDDYPVVPALSQDYQRGDLLWMKYFNNIGSLLREDTYSYDRRLIETISGWRVFSFWGWSPNAYIVRKNRATQYVTALYQKLLTHSEEITYSLGVGVNRKKDIIYGGDPFEFKPVKEVLFLDGKANVTYFRYPFNAASDFKLGLTPDEEAMKNTLLAKNNLAPIEVSNFAEKGLQSELVSGNKTIYGNFNGNQIYPASNKQYTGLTNFTEEFFSIYDNVTGKLVTKFRDSGPKINYVWSYNGIYPVAQIINAENSTVIAALGGQSAVNDFRDNPSPTNQQIASFLTLLRSSSSLQNAHSSTFTYKPLVGMTSSTDAKGMTTTYEYDAFQRLKTIKDQNGNILKQTDYHYKN